jgi:nucleoside-diphosphate-sugar epimerase
VGVDYADVDGLTEVVRTERPTHVFHVAGATKGVTYEDFARANVMPTRHLLDALARAEHDLERFVLVSSLAAWGPSAPDRPHTEDDPPKPVEHYGKSKLEAEEALVASGAPYTILRPGGVFGPGDVDYFELFKTASKGWNLYFGNRDRWFSVVYVDDLVDLALEAAHHPAASNRGYFVADGAPVTWEGFQSLVARAAGRKVRDLDIPELFVDVAAWGGELLSRLDKKPRLANRQKATMGKQSAWTGSIDRARAELGFAPRVDQAEGVERAFAWYREHGWI